MNDDQPTTNTPEKSGDSLLTVFLCGDVMTGRGIDQILPHPVDPVIHEPYMKDARGYVDIAEAAQGPISLPVDYTYIWGDALPELQKIAPDARLINLETSITTSDEYWPKGINYRMHPDNTPCLRAAGVDCCALANNHVLDWGYGGLAETIESLHHARIKTAGAGCDLDQAMAPAVMDIAHKGRVIVFSYGAVSSGIPAAWAASRGQAGVNLLEDLSEATVNDIKDCVQQIRQQHDIVIVSLHWGGNWGYDISPDEIAFAHRLIDDAGVDVVHGHSSHHVKAIEVYKGKPILYGCGDFLNDYEGITGYEGFRDDLSLMYFVTLDPTSGRLISLNMTPTRINRFRINRASETDTRWLMNVLNRESRDFNFRVAVADDLKLTGIWDGKPPATRPD